MKLADLTNTWLVRLYGRIHDRIGPGGCFGWDWPTLRIVHPEKATALRLILDEMKRRSA